MSIKVMIVEDHRIFRDGLRSILKHADDIELVGEASDGESALDIAEQCKPDVVLMDVQLPGINGIETTRRLLKQHPDVKVIILTMFEETGTLVSAMRSGARGYLLKDAGGDQVFRSIRAVAGGEAIFGPKIANRLLNLMSDTDVAAPAALFPELTDREREILLLMVQGLHTEAIAIQSGLSIKTVRNHISNMLNKVGVPSRNDLIARAQAAGMK
jgi:DNA-binding NarL/FixJ family response regulator